MHNSQLVQLSTDEGVRLSHVTNISRMQFFDDSDHTDPVWLQALPLGTYEHPVHGTIDVTPEKVQDFVDNFNNKVRDQDLDIDYDHKLKDTIAAGWVKAAENRGTAGLWIAVDFTKPALEKLKNKEFKYFSSEFQDEWTHPKNGTTYKNVLFGGALTNRPFIKDILPINLNELIDPISLSEPTQTGDAMDEKLKAVLIQRYKLNETATDAEVLAAAAADDTLGSTEVVSTTLSATEDAEDVQLSELAKTNPAVAVLLAEREANNQRIALLELSTKTAKTDARLAQLSETGKFAVPPAVLDSAREVLLSLSETAGDKVFAMLKQLADTGVVELGERGGIRKPDTSPADDFVNAIKKLAEESNISFSDAAAQVASIDPAGFERYRQAVLNY